MGNKRAILIAAAVTALTVVVLILSGLIAGARSGEPPVKINFEGYGDYYGGPYGSRRAEFTVVNVRDGPVKVWSSPCRVEFKDGGAVLPQGVALGGSLLPSRGQATTIDVSLTENEHGPWRVVVPVLPYRIVNFVETWLPGGGAIAGFLDSRCRTSARWVQSDWIDQLPNRPAYRPALAKPGGTNYSIENKGATNATQKEPSPMAR